MHLMSFAFGGVLGAALPICVMKLPAFAGMTFHGSRVAGLKETSIARDTAEPLPVSD